MALLMGNEGSSLLQWNATLVFDLLSLCSSFREKRLSLKLQTLSDWNICVARARLVHSEQHISLRKTAGRGLHQLRHKDFSYGPHLHYFNYSIDVKCLLVQEDKKEGVGLQEKERLISLEFSIVKKKILRCEKDFFFKAREKECVCVCGGGEWGGGRRGLEILEQTSFCSPRK